MTTQTKEKPDAPTEPKPWLDDQGKPACNCYFIDVNPLTKDEEMRQRWDLHEQLRGIETMSALAAVQLIADVVTCEYWPLESDQIERFAGDHQWPDQPFVYALFRQLEEIARAYAKGIKYI
jgi:hypothetical protein